MEVFHALIQTLSCLIYHAYNCWHFNIYEFLDNSYQSSYLTWFLKAVTKFVSLALLGLNDKQS